MMHDSTDPISSRTSTFTLCSRKLSHWRASSGYCQWSLIIIQCLTSANEFYILITNTTTLSTKYPSSQVPALFLTVTYLFIIGKFQTSYIILRLESSQRCRRPFRFQCSGNRTVTVHFELSAHNSA
jgi:hypothetical protein